MKNKVQNFIDAIIPSDILEVAVQWIGENYDPEDVFSNSQLETWAEENGWIIGPPEPEERRS